MVDWIESFGMHVVVNAGRVRMRLARAGAAVVSSHAALELKS